MPDDFATRAAPHVQQLLEPGETLHGLAAAVHQKTFSGQMFALGVTDRRLILLPLDRHIAPKDAPRTVRPEDLELAKLHGAGDGWLTAPMVIADVAALTLELKIQGGEKLKLMLMQGGGGILGSLGGGESQRQGVVALGQWLAWSGAVR